MQGQILRSSFDPLQGLHATCDRLRVQAPSLAEDNVSPVFDGSDNYVNGVYVPSWAAMHRNAILCLIREPVEILPWITTLSGPVIFSRSWTLALVPTWRTPSDSDHDSGVTGNFADFDMMRLDYSGSTLEGQLFTMRPLVERRDVLPSCALEYRYPSHVILIAELENDI
ncbi:predicted protein [Histoplasma capsulatum var. duboisii H88]|uniref:Predicted protein n=1 Tax=Ajellomyces capsulatus (strain H88) TaxID=544711 RepID=F0UVC1_AJEC8|nr:predicted protein [Histoplasma capsulatum var. duboisii H88]